MRLPTRKSEILARTKQVNDDFLTPETIDKMKREIERLLVDRPSLAEEVRRTGAMGDLSENAAYQMAKMSLRRLNSRITILEEKLKTAIVIRKSVDGRVSIGSSVTLISGGKMFTFLILGSQETNPLKGRISYLSPLGRALIGKSVGDIVSVLVGDKDVRYEIQSIT